MLQTGIWPANALPIPFLTLDPDPGVKIRVLVTELASVRSHLGLDQRFELLLGCGGAPSPWGNPSSGLWKIYEQCGLRDSKGDATLNAEDQTDESAVKSWGERGEPEME